MRSARAILNVLGARPEESRANQRYCAAACAATSAFRGHFGSYSRGSSLFYLAARLSACNVTAPWLCLGGLSCVLLVEVNEFFVHKCCLHNMRAGVRKGGGERRILRTTRAYRACSAWMRACCARAASKSCEMRCSSNSSWLVIRGTSEPGRDPLVRLTKPWGTTPVRALKRGRVHKFLELSDLLQLVCDPQQLRRPSGLSVNTPGTTRCAAPYLRFRREHDALLHVRTL